MALPNFVIIGARGAGTTWIHRNLHAHPEVFVSNPKELHFFDREFEKGSNFYASHFEEVTSEKAIGEATPAYLFDPAVPERMSATIPDAKLIACLRNPADLVHTRFLKSLGKGGQKRAAKNAKDLIERKPEVAEDGYYVDHLRRFIERYDRQRLLLLRFDDLKDRPALFMEQLTEFLGVRADVQFPFLEERVNVSAAKKHLSRSIWLYRMTALCDRLGFWKLGRKFERMNTTQAPALEPEIRQWLVDNYFGEKNLELQRTLGLDVAHWNDVS